ncbi:hypothetical protein LCGC14_2583150 [marine sediment metagenome]|uniref:Uncharacterized protein n=1 Tax=marine sediment metagenome TaxID=412755 RepID=A0A0F9CPZ6_9ZZZZ
MVHKKKPDITVNEEDIFILIGKIRKLRANADLKSPDYTANLNLNTGLELACDEIDKVFKFE